MKRLKLIWLGLMLLVGQHNALAAQVLPDWVQDFLASKGYPAHQQSGGFVATVFEDHELIVWENQTQPCFVILTSQNETTRLVAYSTGQFFYGNSEMDGLRAQLLTSLAQPGPQMTGVRKSGHVRIKAPLLSTRWSQGAFFNRFCPAEIRISNGHTWVGCVAVALGQIVRYFGWANSFDVESSYTTWPYGTLQMQSSGYDWSRMLDEPLDFDLDVSAFLSDMGILVHTHYGLDGSSASTGRALHALHDMNYSAAYRVYRRDYSAQEWYDLIVSNLMQDQPVFVAGGGHAFVCDGMDELGFLHFNLGGSGIGDGYYDVSAVYGYPVNEAIAGITPDAPVQPPSNLSCSTPAGGEACLSWSPAPEQNITGYQIYYDDQKWFQTEDTFFYTSGLEPGIYDVKVAALVESEESRTIGPVSVRIPGRDWKINDSLARKTIVDQLPYVAENQGYVNEADLKQIRIFHCNDPEMDPGLLSAMTQLQELSVPADILQEETAPWLHAQDQLQVLCLTGADSSLSVDWSRLSKLVHLRLQNYSGKMSYINEGLRHLRKLYLSGLPASAADEPLNLPFLEELTIAASHAESAKALGSLPSLRYVGMQGNGMTALDLDQGFPLLFEADLSDNRLNSLSFLAAMPHLCKLTLRKNLFENPVLAVPMDQLTVMDLSANRIRDFRIALDYPELERINLSGNQLTTLPVHFFALRNLRYADLSENRINHLTHLSIPSLEDLNLASNALTWLPCLAHFSLLRKLNLANNQISDISVLCQENLPPQLKMLDLRGNPLSKESFSITLPRLLGSLDDLQIPTQPEPLAPCYPEPGPRTRAYLQSIRLGWTTGAGNSQVDHELILRQDDSIIRIVPVGNPCETRVSLSRGQVYSWQVRAVTDERDFYSGLYHIMTTDQMELPYNEQFEEYSYQAGITTSSHIWRIRSAGGDMYCDAPVLSSGEPDHNKILSILPETDIMLDASDLDRPVLDLAFDLLVPGQQAAHFVVSGLDGLQINVGMKNGSGSLYANGQKVATFLYHPGLWNRFSLHVAAKNNYVFAYMNKQRLIDIPWSFREGLASGFTLGFGADRDAFLEEKTLNRFWVDNLVVSGLGGATAVEDLAVQEEPGIQVSRDPLTGDLRISKLPVEGKELTLEIFSVDGRLLQRHMLGGQTGESRLSMTNLSQGLCLIRIRDPEVILLSRRIFIQ